jgi:hypothetical protein
MRVRFPSAIAAAAGYEKQRTQHHNMDTQASRLLSNTCQVCPTFIPTGYMAETSHEDSLHKAYIACPMFIGMDNASLQQLFRDNLQEIHDILFDIDADALAVPEDYYSAIA